MSGRFTPSVYIFEIDSNPRNKHKAGNSLDESYKLYEIDGWGKPVETLYPILYVSERNIVYVLKGRSGQDEPGVETFKFRKFSAAPKSEPIVFNSKIELPHALEAKRHLIEPDVKDTYRRKEAAILAGMKDSPDLF